MLERREPDPFADVFTGLVAARAVTSAVPLGVFEALHDEPADAAVLASRAVPDGPRRPEPGGCLVIGDSARPEPGEQVSPQGAISSLLFYAWSHSRSFTPAEVRGWMLDSGFREVELHRNERSPWRVVLVAR